MAQINKQNRTALLLLSSILSFYLVTTNPNPVFFDIFGIFIFTFLFVIGGKLMKTKRVTTNTAFIIRTIGLLGLIVDGLIVLQAYS